MQRAILVLMVAMVLMTIGTGCRRDRDLSAENDRLRERVIEMEREIDQLTRRNRELQSALRRAERAADRPVDPLAEHMPHVTGISISRLSHARDTIGDDELDSLLVYVRSIDGRGRFVQLVGDLIVHAAVLPADEEARTVGRVRLDPTEVRDAYRSGFTGTHYAVTVPLDLAVLAAAGMPESVVVRAVFLDGQTGEEFTAEQTVRLDRPGWRARRDHDESS